ncbi:FHA domain-containing protein [Sanguibacter hominis ATCC BAA-789]|uniref:FHA domain-containing protein n=1 Tax=Sanguibacter hominis ATCC BAA-789 TaxID=1312740 RepID=A0A9X5FDS8_9MICO|nr:FHA domain-containing protein [Sanguibacter hominis]NKX92324.1 FHA domain-containing protein [Sanguibacter hominis ATCC BAA-789]
MIVPRYLPGRWVAVVAEGCVALLPEGTLPSVLDAVWDMLRAGEGMDALLPVLTGSRAHGAFGLVEMSGPTVRAYLRGEVELEAVGGRALDASTVLGDDSRLRAAGTADVPWVGVEWADVDEFTVRAVEEAPTGASARRGTGYTVLAGVVPAACVTVHLRLSVSLPASSIGGAAAVGDAELEEELYGDTILSMPAGLREDVEATRVRVDAQPFSVPTAPSPSVPSPPAPTPPPAHQAGARVRAVEDHDGETILSSDLVEIRRSLSSWAHPQVPGPFAVPTEIAPAKLVMSSGLVVTLDRAVLIGRAPVVSRVANRDLPRLVTVPSPHHDISRTHAQVVQEGQRVFVTDLDSTNGVVLHARGQAPQRVRPGVPVEISPDATVDIGDGVTFRVVRS